jgi:hypothetical protein
MVRFDNRNEVCVERDCLGYEIATINRCVMFFKGTIFQGERLLESLESRNHDFRKRMILEEEFFVFALDRAIFHIKMIESIPEFKDIIKQIDTAIGCDSIKDTRDMRTHFNNYQKKDTHARKQSSFFVTPDISSSQFPYNPSIDATSSIMVGDNYLIGGRIDFHKTMELLKKLLPNVKELCQSRRFELVKLQANKQKSDL